MSIDPWPISVIGYPSGLVFDIHYHSYSMFFLLQWHMKKCFRNFDLVLLPVSSFFSAGKRRATLWNFLCISVRLFLIENPQKRDSKSYNPHPLISLTGEPLSSSNFWSSCEHRSAVRFSALALSDYSVLLKVQPFLCNHFIQILCIYICDLDKDQTMFHGESM